MAGNDTQTVATTPVSKLRPPRVRHAEVTRDHLLQDERLAACDVVVICAAAGFGKSTFAIQWASRSQRPIAWATLDESDNDPLVLLQTLTAALSHALGPIPVPPGLTADEPAFSRRVLPGFLTAVAAGPQPVTLVLDDVHHVSSAQCRRVLKAIVDALPPGSQAAFIGRSAQAIPVALWRGQGRTAELFGEDLTFDPHETAEAVRSFHSQARDDDVHLASGGWPVAVFLLSQTTSTRSLANVAEFIETEVLAVLADPLRSFTLAVASLGAVNADLARAVTAEPASADLLAHGVSTVLLAPTGDGWFQFHPLMQDCAVDIMRREDPERLREVWARAARWHLEQGHPDLAASFAIGSHDGPTMGPVVWEASRVALLLGRTRTVVEWLDRIGPRAIDQSAELSMTAAWTYVAAGHYGRVVRHAEQTLTLMPDDWLNHPQDFSIGPALALLIGITHLGVADAHEALVMAEIARRHIRPDEPISALASTVLGVDLALVGDPRARAALRDAAEIAKADGITSTQAEAHALLALTLFGAGEDTLACSHAQQAMDVMAFHDLVDMSTTSAVVALANVATAAVRGRESDIRAAMDVLEQLRIEAQKVLAWYGPLSGAVLAFACARIGDQEGYRLHRSWCADADGLIGMWRTRADQQFAATTPLTALTPAELRVWELLKGRMTLNEIAGALFLSRETVKSHTGSIYRKIGVSSRREAQELAERW